jgi:hypothetical protein
MAFDAPTDHSHEILNSWKEIASYLDRGVRTVQRWEHDLQLPVHRIGRCKRSPVYAIVSELKFWMIHGAGRRAMLTHDGAKSRGDSGGRKRNPFLAARVHDLAQAVAQASARHQRQAEALEKNILALRSRFSLRKSK